MAAGVGAPERRQLTRGAVTSPPPADPARPSRLYLAPMEGVVDHTLRDLLTRDGAFDRCVTEFVRVTDRRLPGRVFRRYCPELGSGGTTPAGTPVFVQLLGSEPAAMALNARAAARLGAPGIDLNFGCPAKTVNRHGGGSALLAEPARVAAVVRAVRDAVDPAIPVTAKIRLGVDDCARFEAIAAGVQAAGASELCVHARTRRDGYRPPAHWQRVRAVSGALTIPVVINGEVWTRDDAGRALAASGCDVLMLGRGSLSAPGLARQIRSGESPLAWPAVLAMVRTVFEASCALSARQRHVGDRTKQWLTYLKRGYPEAGRLFDAIKRLRDGDEIRAALTRA